MIPLRWSAAHLCIPNDPMCHMLKALVLLPLRLNGRKMLRMHIGTPMECDCKLRSFRMPTDDIPRTNVHTIKVKNCVRLIKTRKLVDDFVEKAWRQMSSWMCDFPVLNVLRLIVSFTFMALVRCLVMTDLQD